MNVYWQKSIWRWDANEGVIGLFLDKNYNHDSEQWHDSYLVEATPSIPLDANESEN